MLLADMSNTEMHKEVTMMKPDVSPVSPSKKEKQPLVELKNGKVMFRQKPLSCEKMTETMQEIVKFRDFLRNRGKEETSPLQDIPEEHVPLIAKLVHESDKTIGFLAKHIQGELQPEELGGGGEANSHGASLASNAVESAILRLCDRVNYGIDWVDKASASASAWRWELKEEAYDMLPKTAREKFEARLTERRQAKKQLKTLFDALPEAEKDAFMKNGRKAKQDISSIPPVNDENKPSNVSVIGALSDMKVHDFTEDDPDSKSAIGRLKKDKPVDQERLAKEKERAERKAAKEERERKQQEAQNKSRSIMSSFFSKPKASSSKLLRPAAASSSFKTESSSQSEFERMFKPFILRKDATLAPVNYFLEERKAKEIIVIDPEPSSGLSNTVPRTSQPMSLSSDVRELLTEYISTVSSKPRSAPKTYSANGVQYKASSMFCVRDIVAQLSEAEVMGDDVAVRSLQALLRSRDKIPAKVLIFHEDIRPGYFGTFTKSSTVVGPRTPFGKDAVAFDYSYDSGEDWEEEEEGGDDLLSLNGSDIEKSSDVGSEEFDDWLVDDDEPVDPGTPLSERAGSPGFPLPNDLLPKRKSTVEGEIKEPKKRKVMPLVPFSKGPCLEVNIGECEYEPFNQYRLQLFNDTPFPVDPFTFVSTPVIVERSAPSKQTFAIPALPPRVQVLSSNPDSTDPTLPAFASDITAQPSASPIATVPATVKRTPAQPKNPFPPTLLPYFADKVASLSSGNLTWLVESLYQDLRAHRVKKNAIEAKVREDCEKCPVRKIWIVKEDVLRSLGRTPVPLPNPQ